MPSIGLMGLILKSTYGENSSIFRRCRGDRKMDVRIPHGSIFRPIVKRFTATFGSPTIGKYDFGTVANRNVKILPISQANLFYISILNFSASIVEGAFLENIE